MHLGSPKAGLIQALLDKRRGITLGVAAALGALLLLLGGGEGLDRLLRSVRDSIRFHDASGEIHVVEIDKRSLDAIDRWPWPRSVHGAIIDRLHQAGARSIAFDVDFSASSFPAEDGAMAAALVRAGHRVILPTFRQAAGSGSSGYIDSIPAKPFREKAFLAAVTVVTDPDGYVRSMPLGIETIGTPRPSLASMLAEHDAEIDRYFEIDFSVDPSSIPRHSAVDLVNGKIPASELAGKRVIIGATAVEMGDRYAVPNYGVIPGVVIQAIAAETLLDGRTPSNWGGLLPLAATMLLIGWAVRRGSRPRRIAVFGLGFVAVLALPLVTESLVGISFLLAPAILAAASAASLAAAAYALGRYRERALTDEATGLPNLAALQEDALGVDHVGLAVARIERFAAIASGLGPAATAKLVARVAERIRYAAPERQIYRVDEATLAWIEPRPNESRMEEDFARIAALMRTPVECGRLVDVTLTIGYDIGDGADAKQLAADAGLAAVRAAQAGERWGRFSKIDGDEADWHLSLLGELDAAMAEGQVWNAYQPKLDIASGEIIGVEALVRWLHPKRGPIAPDRFMPMVEQNGRARDLTEHVLGEALEDAARWEAAGFPIGVAVNMSATLLADHEFIELVGQRLRGSRIATGRITIEVTESAAMASPERAIAALESWRALGVHISIDDYGTGQSSLGYLQKLPASELKIDKSFIEAIVRDKRDEIMVRSTIALAHELGIKVVAEGIEDAACLQMLHSMGCDTAQGYHIARPMPADAMLEFLADRSREAA